MYEGTEGAYLGEDHRHTGTDTRALDEPGEHTCPKYGVLEIMGDRVVAALVAAEKYAGYRTF